jgi:Spy/CpxP family protein refolding chaperone
MDIFSQKKLLLRIVIILVVLNLFSISAFLWKEFFHKPPHPPKTEGKRDVSSILMEDLNLTDIQAEQIKNLRTAYFAKEKNLETAIREERDSMNEVMFNKTTDEEIVKDLAKRIAANDYEMELMRFEQAKEFKSICTMEQLEKFEGLVLEIRDYFKPDNPPKKE